ncbi:MAG: phage terminase small subunit P27 family, partial [Nitrospirales bacterium]
SLGREHGPGARDKPTFLDDFAGEEWDRLTGMLVSARVITRGDGGIILVAADASQLRQCQEFLKEKGSLSYDASSINGGTSYKPYPEVGQRNMARRQYQSALSELGLSPSSRSKVKTLPEPPKTKGTARFFTS